MLRIATLLCALVLLAPAPAALAQGSPFGPLPPAAPTPTPEPEQDSSTDVFGQDVGRATLFAIAGGFVVLFAGIVFVISRDARRALPRGKRETAAPQRLTPRQRRARERSKARARQKTRAQKQARKAHRKR
jgi:hypothetical protein